MPLRKFARRAIIASIWLLIWWGASLLAGQTLLLPSPPETGRALLRLVRQAAFWQSAALSIVRVCLGFALGLLLGGGLAVLTCRFPWWHAFLSPFLSAIKATPVASFIVLALVWIRVGGVPSFATVLVVLPIVWANVSAGLRATDPLLLEMTRGYGLKVLGRVRVLYWPTVRPYGFAAVTTGMGMAWKAGVAAEIIAMPRLSLGNYLYEAKVYLDTPALFAATAVIIALSVLLEKCVAWLIRSGKERPHA